MLYTAVQQTVFYTDVEGGTDSSIREDIFEDAIRGGAVGAFGETHIRDDARYKSASGSCRGEVGESQGSYIPRPE